MSTHINAANKNDIAESILLPGDPLRAKFIAENFLDSPKCYNEIRGMLGYTGTYRGVPVSVQGTGMGMPSMGIYSWELITEYGVQNLIRIGTAGSFHEDIKVRDIVVGMAASDRLQLHPRIRRAGKLCSVCQLQTALRAGSDIKAAGHPVQSREHRIL